MNRIFVAVVLIGSMIVGITSTWADDWRPDREKIQERIETLTMWKMMNALNLDKQTSEKILQIRSDFLKRRKELRSSLGDDFRQLRRMLKESKGDQDTSQLAELLKRIRDKRRELSTLWDTQYEQVSKVLSVRKQAELVLFFKDLHREMRSLVLRSMLHRLRQSSSASQESSDPGAGPQIRRGQSPGVPQAITPEHHD
jgi:Spy/CpxP family protein refolding chaperone